MDGKTVSQFSWLGTHTHCVDYENSFCYARGGKWSGPHHRSPPVLNVGGGHNIICCSYDLGFVNSLRRTRYESEHI